MREPCPICSREFPVQFLQRHVNTCLDTLEVPKNTPSPPKKIPDAFSALGLKADSRKSTEKTRKGGATLTSILIAEKRLKRRRDELETRLLQKMAQLPKEDNAEKAMEREGKEEVKREGKEEVKRRENEGEGGKEQEKRKEEEGRGKAEERYASEVKDEEGEVTDEVTEVTEEVADVAEREEWDGAQARVQAQSAGVVAPAESASGSGPSVSGPAPGAASEFERAREIATLRREADLPLAHRLRPKTLDDFYGQEKLVGHGGVLRNLLAAPQMPSFILWGVPGVGKTSLARILSQYTSHRFVELSGASSTAKSLREAFAAAQRARAATGTRTLLFLDEIHRFSTAVQDLLLPVVEDGSVTVVGATTENPSFRLNHALLSRMHTFVMEPLAHGALVKIVSRGLLLVNKTRRLVHGLALLAVAKDAVDHVARLAAGDSRVALNIVECVHACFAGERFRAAAAGGVVRVSREALRAVLRTRGFAQRYDRAGDSHYDAISALHKAVRGGDADAAVFYLARMLAGGEDPLFIARRMVVIASEDVGVRDSSCLPFAVAASEAVRFVGMPEAEIVLAHCAVKLARAPKSTKAYRALRAAQALVARPDTAALPIPMHLRNAPTRLMKDLGYGDAYKYNPDFEHGLVRQSYLPPELAGTTLVEPTHLGARRDAAVPDEAYAAAQRDADAYRQYKRRRRAAGLETAGAAGPEPLGAAAARGSSYDENLSKDDQPEYFDGSERDHYADDPECVDNFECSYDEFQQA